MHRVNQKEEVSFNQVKFSFATLKALSSEMDLAEIRLIR